MTNELRVYEAICTFLDRKGQNSKNTRATYLTAYSNFFRSMRGKELKDLTVEDLIFSTYEIDNYQVELRKKYKSNTVNTRMFALKKLYEKLESYGFPVKASWFEVDSYTEHDATPSDPMTHAEVVKAITIVRGTRNGDQKALLIRLAYATAFRKESLLELKKTDIINRNGVWFVRVLGKGQKWDYKKITQDLYEELMKRAEKATGDKIFTLQPRTVRHMMDLIRSEIDFGERNIKFHSLKKSSIEEVRLITDNDLKAMQAHANHSDPQTTIRSYLSNRKLDEMVTVDINYHVPVEAFDHLTHEQLLDLVKSVDRNTQIKLLQKMGVI